MHATTEHLHLGPARLVARGSALALVLGLLTSCGGDDDAPGTTTTTSASASASASGETTTDAQDTSSEDDSADSDDSDDEAAEAVVIVIADFDYEVPDSVPPGAEITVRNEDGVGHTVTSDDESTFDVAVGPGEEVTMTAPDEPGEFPFFCRPHPSMRATLVVGEG